MAGGEAAITGLRTILRATGDQSVVLGAEKTANSFDKVRMSIARASESAEEARGNLTLLGGLLGGSLGTQINNLLAGESATPAEYRTAAGAFAEGLTPTVIGMAGAALGSMIGPIGSIIGFTAGQAIGSVLSEYTGNALDFYAKTLGYQTEFQETMQAEFDKIGSWLSEEQKSKMMLSERINKLQEGIRARAEEIGFDATTTQQASSQIERIVRENNESFYNQWVVPALTHTFGNLYASVSQEAFKADGKKAFRDFEEFISTTERELRAETRQMIGQVISAQVDQTNALVNSMEAQYGW